MKKSMCALAVASLFTFVAVSASFAAKVDCTVDGVNANQVTLTCDKEKAKTLKAGEKVKAAKVACTVDGVTDGQVTLTCDKAKNLKAGEKVHVGASAAKKKAHGEGC